MTLTQDIQLREYGIKGVFSTQLPSVLDRIECHRDDVHHIEAREFGECTPPLCCSFAKLSGHNLAVADEDGGILILDTNKHGISAVQQDWLAHRNAVFDVDWMPSENKLLTASGDQTVVLWDVESEEKVSTFKGHSSSVKTARFAPQNKHIFVTGARDGHIMMYDTRIKEKEGHVPAVNVIRSAHHCSSAGSAHKKRRTNQQETAQSVTAVLFQDEATVISTGSVDGSIKVWDTRKNYTVSRVDPLPKHVFLYSGSSARAHGFSSLTLNSSGSSLFANCMDNIIYQYDTVAYGKTPVACYQGHKNTTFYIKSCLSPDDNYLMSGSSDSLAYVWSVRNPSAQPWTLEGHNGEVSAVGWSLVSMATVSDDSTIRLWRLGGERDSHSGNMDVVGKSQRPQHKGVSVSAADLCRTLTPRKGAVVARSPVKMSPVVMKSVQALSGSKSRPHQDKSPHSIKKWFSVGQSSAARLSPLKKTPRKLLITPKKSPLTTPLESSQPQDSQGSYSVKRKLYDDRSPGTTAKRQRTRTEDGYFAGHVQDENSCDGFVGAPEMVCDIATCERVLTESSLGNKDTVTPVKPKRRSGDALTPVRSFNPTLYRSPTVDLPNYVLDPAPRTPVARASVGARTPTTPNWLTQLCLQRSASKPRDGLETTPGASEGDHTLQVTPQTTPCRKNLASKHRDQLDTTPRSTGANLRTTGSTPHCKNSTSKPCTSLETAPRATGTNLRSVKTTPRRKKGLVRGRGSISQYFSPGVKGKQQTSMDTTQPAATDNS